MTSGLPLDERAVLARARHDPRAFAPLYQAYVDPVHRYCMRCLGDREAAADATQEVFARALRALPRYRDDAFRPWLFTIARNGMSKPPAVSMNSMRPGRHPRPVLLTIASRARWRYVPGILRRSAVTE